MDKARWEGRSVLGCARSLAAVKQERKAHQLRAIWCCRGRYVPIGRTDVSEVEKAFQEIIHLLRLETELQREQRSAKRLRGQRGAWPRHCFKG